MAGKPGPKSEEHKKRISEALKGKPKSEECKRKLSEARAGVPWNDPDGSRRAALRAWMQENHPTRGKSLTPEWKAKLSESHKGKSWRMAHVHGIGPERYSAEIAAGNRWCWYGKHFTAATQFTAGKKGRGVCIDHTSEANRVADLKKKFNTDQAWYDAKLAEQGGCCAICGTAERSKGNKHFAVDHNHATGATRGLLCSRCNTAIERMESIQGWGMKALAYLTAYKTGPES